ncbi:MAG TPA: FKBP-type peptidyl-prolyl cis-trans isomerase [Terracidiphilus sp.]|jgi:peptidylprolyl isomerase|nr:FKBP-type peptidyl-prolyl cis-trans isomerase [Terracidiphilus sp.]
MRQFAVFLLAAAMAAALGQTSPSSSNKPAAAAHVGSTASGIKLPPGIPPVHGLMKTAFSLRYQDIKIGTKEAAEPNKLYKVMYTGYLAADGRKFDSSEDHRMPLRDKDGKPVLGADGKPVLGDPEPLTFPQGFGRLIPGFDQGFGGMKVGGKRRLFIPWQLAYGAKGRPGPDAAHPGIPPKADLIFDIELVGIEDMPTQPMRPPGAMPRPGAPAQPGHPTSAPPAGGAQSSPTQPAAPSGQSTAPTQQSAPSSQSTTPAQPTAPQQPQL